MAALEESHFCVDTRIRNLAFEPKARLKDCIRIPKGLSIRSERRLAVTAYCGPGPIGTPIDTVTCCRVHTIRKEYGSGKMTERHDKTIPNSTVKPTNLPDDLPDKRQRRWINWVRCTDGQWKLDKYPLKFSVSHYDRVIRPDWMSDPVKVGVVLLFYYPHYKKNRKRLNHAYRTLLEIDNWKNDGKRATKRLRRVAAFGDALLYFSRSTDPSDKPLRKPSAPLSDAERRLALTKMFEEGGYASTTKGLEEMVEAVMSHKRLTIPTIEKIVESPTFHRLLAYCRLTLRSIDNGVVPTVFKLSRWTLHEPTAMDKTYPPALQQLRNELMSIQVSLALYEDELADPDLLPDDPELLSDDSRTNS
jgi:hypothetical protein